MPRIISMILAQTNDNSRPDQRELSGQIHELEHSLPRFGPCCGEDSEAIKHAKIEAWKHVVEHTLDEEQDSVYGTYLTAIRVVEKDARNIYPPESLKGFIDSRFREMMVIDGCFFLQWAISILGGSKLLGYHSNFLYFGENKNKESCFGENKNKKSCLWIEAMFFVGNQIPYVVLRELMKQTFFQSIITKGIENGTWFNLPSDNFPKMVLYQLVVSPFIRISSRWLKFKHRMSLLLTRQKEASYYFPENPSDLLDATYRFVLGPAIIKYGGSDSSGDNDRPDLEAGTDERDSKDRFRSATELKLSGIKFARAKGGIRQTYFSTLWLFHGRLRMSPLTFDRNSESMLQCLKDYEVVQKRDKNTHEVASYLGFLKDLIQTTMDVHLLKSRGIVVLNDIVNDELPRMLRRLCASEEIPLTENLRLARMRAIYYTSPQRRAVINVTLLLTLIQTAVTIVSLNVPGK